MNTYSLITSTRPVPRPLDDCSFDIFRSSKWNKPETERQVGVSREFVEHIEIEIEIEWNEI